MGVEQDCPVLNDFTESIFSLVEGNLPQKLNPVPAKFHSAKEHAS
jgi:hypothetical protein